jgi:hypothetical protein
VVSQKAPAPTAAKIAAVVSTRSVSAHVMCLPIAPARRPPISRLGGGALEDVRSEPRLKSVG